MDPSADINKSVTGSTALQAAVSGLPKPGASTEEAASRAICKALPLLSVSVILPALRPLFTPLGINLDKLISEQRTDGQEEDEAANESTFECPICIGAYIRPTAIKVCGHVFCGDCIAEAVAKHKKCPTCQAKATKRHLLRIYLS